MAGSVVSSLYNDSGSPIFIIYEFFNPSTFAMEDRTITTSTGTKTGALIVDNMTGQTQGVTVSDAGGPIKNFSIPPAGVALTAAQLAANRQNNGGPIRTIQDLAGISPSLIA
jgi:hypothetical protein